MFIKHIQRRFFLLFHAIALLTSCNAQENQIVEQNDKETPIDRSRPVSFENGKIIEVDGVKMLYGGRNEDQNFIIDNSELNDRQYHYGMGREAFPALLEPVFISVTEADKYWSDDDRFLLAYSGNEVKAYSVKDLTRHEIVNDVLDGKPIMAAYCILADLGAIYERQYNNEVLTFALSGYTYYDNNVWDGLDGFVLWDRETESLWWPLIGRAVSGSLKGVKLLEMDKTNWKDTTWKEIKDNYSNAQVLKSGQDFIRPATWDKIEDVSGIVSKYR